MKHIVTQEDLELNPELMEEGVEVGDEIDLPETEETEDGKVEYEEAEVVEEESQGGDLSVKI